MRTGRCARPCGVVAALLLMLGCATMANARLLVPPEWSGMRGVSDKVVVEQTADAHDDERASAIVAEARERLAGRSTDDYSVLYPTAGDELRRWIAIAGFKSTYRRLEAAAR